MELTVFASERERLRLASKDTTSYYKESNLLKMRTESYVILFLKKGAWEAMRRRPYSRSVSSGRPGAACAASAARTRLAAEPAAARAHVQIH